MNSSNLNLYIRKITERLFKKSRTNAFDTNEKNVIREWHNLK